MSAVRSFKKVLVANRGEIAMRILRTLKDLGLQSAVLYHRQEIESPALSFADEAFEVFGDTPVSAYLDIPQIVELCKTHGVDAVHPGYGFLAENAAFVRALDAAGVCFIGPRPEVMNLMGDKIGSRDFVAERGFPIAPSVIDDGDEDKLIASIIEIGFPVLIKASAGGGGKGMQIVREADGLRDIVATAKVEAQRYFGDPRVYAERYIESPRHIEVQVLGDEHGNCVHLWERECSIQRRFQKVIEETPSPALTPELRKDICESAVGIAKATNYTGAGTIEFIFAPNGDYYFLEMNTRIQVEHPITEMVTGVDLVAEQVRIAMGHPLSYSQEEIKQVGHAIECRICAEIPDDDFAPAAGKVLMLRPPVGEGMRFDSGSYEGQKVGTAFDSMIAKLIVHAEDRDAAIARAGEALEQFVLLGVETNSDYLGRLLRHPAFIAGETNTGFIKDHAADLGPDALSADLQTAVLATAALSDRQFVAMMDEVPYPYRLMKEWRN
ncbi:MAG: ATP-grasp domain-containing protein [Zhongshania sp.]|nr:ATP-grasp domain-containing protein [Zhongshania sp.]